MKFAALFLSFVFSIHVCAQQDLELKLKGSVTADSVQAARGLLQTQLTEKAALAAIHQLIGEKKASENKNPVRQVLRQTNKFIPYFKGGEVVQTPTGYDMESNIRVSLVDLRALLLKNGLLYEKEGSWLVLPLIKISDKVNSQQYIWWSTSGAASATSFKTAARLESSLRSKFLQQGFFVLRPAQTDLALSLPAGLLPPTLNFDEQQRLAQRLSADLILTGEIEITPHRQFRSGATLIVKILGTHRVTSRVVGEVVRQVHVENFNQGLARDSNFFDDVSTDLALQVFETWKKGTLGAELIQVQVHGAFTPQMLEKFKSWVLEKAPQIKTLKERRFDGDSITFEADITSPVSEVAASLNTNTSEQFAVRVGDTSDKNLELYWSLKK